MQEWDAQGLSSAMAICHAARTRRGESMVQGEGGYSLVLDRVKQAEAGMHGHFDVIEGQLDQALDEILCQLVRQLTKLEEEQAVVLNANFEAVHKYIRILETKLGKIAPTKDK